MCYHSEPPSADPNAWASPAEPPRLVESTQCRNCGYELLGLTYDTHCPECGAPVARSIGPDLLVYSSPEHLGRLHRGAFVVLTSIIVLVAMNLAGIALGIVTGLTARPMVELQYLLGIIGLANSAAMAWGWWLLSSPDPASREGMRGEKARKLVRILTVAGLVLATLTQAAALALPYLMPAMMQFQQQAQQSSGGQPPAVTPAVITAMAVSLVLQLIVLGAWASLLVAQMYYIRWLAPRLPDPWVFGRAKLLMWLVPLLYTVGSFCIGIGPLVAMALYWNMLDRVRRSLKQIRIEQQSDALSPGRA